MVIKRYITKFGTSFFFDIERFIWVGGIEISVLFPLQL